MSPCSPSDAPIASAVLPSAPASTSRSVGCVERASVFHHRLVEEPLSRRASAAERRQQDILLAEAAATCATCPARTACLYRAVADRDVAGFVAGTTRRQRSEIRRRLGIRVTAEDFDTMAGVVGGGQVDHDEVLRLRAAHPDESLEALARRLGCSLSTVKRHLRRERTAPAGPPILPPKPDLRDVLVVAAEVTAGSQPASRAA